MESYHFLTLHTVSRGLVRLLDVRDIAGPLEGRAILALHAFAVAHDELQTFFPFFVTWAAVLRIKGHSARDNFLVAEEHPTTIL